MVAPGRTIKRWIPAVYGTRMKLVCVQEADLREEVVPAKFRMRTRTVTVAPERATWRRLPCETCSEAPCGCKPQECWTKEICPAKHEEVCEPVCVEPSRYRLNFRPAQYKLVPERYEIEPARCEEVQIPPRFEVRTKRVCTCAGKWGWRQRPAPACPPPAPTPPAAPLPPPAPAPLAALQVELDDQRPDGSQEGVFSRGELVRYTVRVTHDDGSLAMPDLRVVFTLPPALEFVRGSSTASRGGALDLSGEGQRAQTGTFSLGIGDVRTIHVLARVIDVPPRHLVQFAARVESAEGVVLAHETESTTLQEGHAVPVGVRPEVGSKQNLDQG